ncbi:PIG-L deacetylase family protein [Limimaricola litoreus]|uniref:PIG-L family deacetylase n=1 Tax=Limimaricola litoreus TaxID=2955316 RepID=A0A9X2JN41_9RHOB|nr:PIG-L family deacetylase [Limimaricola litoreus]MCP1168252.1 PIG-L family deacetylase [Limimaricola litoreus]
MADRTRAASFEDLSEGHPPLVLAPHPDDESLGCGALLAAAFKGPGARVVCMTDGGASHPGSREWPRARLSQLRAQELDAAIVALGGEPSCITRLGLPDASMPGLSPRFEEIAQDLVALAEAAGARVLIAPAPTDPHCDHEATAEIATIAARRGGLRLLFYPVWSVWHDPDYRARLPHLVEYRFDTTAARHAKAAAIAAHRSQHGKIVQDDPEGFVLPQAFLKAFQTGDEIYFEAAA